MSETCKNCGRTVATALLPPGRYHGRVVTATVQHDEFGCDSDCCGHRIYGYDARGEEVCLRFDFAHPDSNAPEDLRRFAEEMVAAVFGPDVALNMEESDPSW
jgi:hypothetical protein